MRRRLPIPGWPGYFATEDGNIISKRYRKPLKPGYHKSGYAMVVLSNNGHKQNCYVHRLMLEAFVGPCPKNLQCRHLDGNPINNRPNNLKWGTPTENQLDRKKHSSIGCECFNNNAKLNACNARTIIYMYRTGLFSMAKIGQFFTVTKSCISYIINRKRWRHIWS